ncbi:phosphoribosylanthranilate isomerase [Paenibacillus endoradicis]|uniref:phosphoribosylanthranilate isomerase n=1 Tax=Paenibacillus endoradicis TaxID=2972487 RepID=UPI0021597DC1|nr:phosphoribosylanthranilate isomerase [Paenibacillus endoradicis]MCR8660289.1 phosphoribosylanthranilate isomerase [Paenibacillus endoradicis]
MNKEILESLSIKPRIKICGLRDVATIEAMEGLPIQEVGLLFAPSKRQVTPAQAEQLVAAIHRLSGAKVRAVGVFVNHPLEEMTALLQNVPLDVVQLHGNEDAQYYSQLHEAFPNVALWKVISIDKQRDHHSQMEQQIRDELTPFLPYVESILIDAPGGGTGKPFNWEAIAAYRAVADQFELPLYVAGGLHAGNVVDLITSYHCDGIDVSSGVESDGMKDLHKINEFVRKVIEA